MKQNTNEVLRDKVAIITGGAGGIGAATGALYARHGASVLLVDTDAKLLEEAVASCESAQVSAFVADVSDPVAADAYVAAAEERYGGLDICFANAGVEGDVGPLIEQRLENLERVLAINVRGVFLAMRAAIPKMIARGGGSFIATSSVAGLVGAEGLGCYVASKHAVIGLTRTAALEYGRHGVRCNSIHPGPIDNRMMRSIETQAAPGSPEAVKAGFEQQIPLGRYGRNGEIAELALFLASSGSSYCNGAQFVADGGYVAH